MTPGRRPPPAAAAVRAALPPEAAPDKVALATAEQAAPRVPADQREARPAPAAFGWTAAPTFRQAERAEPRAMTRAMSLFATTRPRPTMRPRRATRGTLRRPTTRRLPTMHRRPTTALRPTTHRRSTTRRPRAT